MRVIKVVSGLLLTGLAAAGIKNAFRGKRRISAKNAGKRIDKTVNDASKQIARIVRHTGKKAGAGRSKQAGKTIDKIATHAQDIIKKNASSAKRKIPVS